MSDELKPCPFCGNKFPAVGYDSDMRALERPECITARCRQCGAETRKFSAPDRAVHAWNTRAAPKVKPLVWLSGSSGTSKFPAWRSDGGLIVESLNFGGFTWMDQSFDSLEAAKAAAQADYETRILSALEGVDA